MKLASIVLKCLGCKAKEKRTEMPRNQPFCPKCGMPMLLEKITAKGAK